MHVREAYAFVFGQEAGRMNLNHNKTFYIESLGCITNKTDAARVETFFKMNGWSKTSSSENASLIILMTCAFTKGSEDYNINRLRQLSGIKKPESQIAVGGCLPSISPDRLKKEFNGFVFSPRTLEKLNTFIPSQIKIEKIPPIGFEPKDSSIKTIRISTGCMGHCTYCAIPFANGRTKSRSIENILRDIREASESGFRQIKLVSEDLGAYGQDLNKSIIQLLEKIVSESIDFELYLDNLNPNWLLRYKQELIDIFRSDKVVKKFSIPIQSGSDRILGLMKRSYTVAEVKTILDDLLRTFPEVKICTDFIVGFPSETDVEFEETRLLLNANPYHYVEIFTYEDRPGTKAMNLTPKILDQVKEERRQLLFKEFLKQFLKSNNIRNTEELKQVMQTRKGLPVHFNLAV